ncbi:TonB-dependent receptor [Daejeonella lutea]|nr:TonB-dependent receptor [Daejeonella lutea]
MRKILLLLLCVITLGVDSLTAQQLLGELRGKITTSDGLPAGFVSIGIKGLNTGTLSKEDGTYRLVRLRPGRYTIKVSALGLEAREQEVTVQAGKTIQTDFVLTENAQRLKEIVVTGFQKPYNTDVPSSSLRLNQPLKEVPQNIQVVTSGTLSDQQVISMSDNLIRNVSGATRLEHWGDMYTNITMRGSQIQAFRNGFNVVSSFWGPLTEDMSFVDRIEFVKGPAGFMLSQGDPSGLYNVVTKKPTGQTKGEASLTLGSYDLFRTALDLDGKLSKSGKLLYRLNVAAQNKGSHRAYEYNNRYSFAPVLSYQLDEKTKLTAEYTMQYAKMSNVGSYYVFGTNGYATLPVGFTMMAPGLEPTRIKDHSGLLSLEHAFSSKWKLNAQASYFNYGQVGSSMWPVSVAADGKIVRGPSIWDAKSEMAMGQMFLTGDVTTGAVRHRILSGLDVGKKDYMADWGQYHNLDEAGGEFDVNNPNYGVPSNGFPVWDRSKGIEERAVLAGGLMDQRYTGLYLQDELGFLENKLRLTLGGRYTFVSQSSWGGAAIEAKHFTPRLGISASIDNQTSIYGLYDQAFTPQNGRLAGGGDVKPITGNNIEFGIKNDWFGGSWNTTLAAYRILKNNELTADPNSPPTSGLSIVLGEKKSEGIEFDLRGEVFKGLNLVANYAYTNARVTEVSPGVTSVSVGDVIPGYAKHVVNSWLNYRIQSGFLKGAGASAGFTYLLDRATDTWSDTDVRLPDFFRLDAGLTWQKDRINITANAFNVLDKYLYSGSYYTWLNAFYWQTEAPRNFRMSVGYKF